MKQFPGIFLRPQPFRMPLYGKTERMVLFLKSFNEPIFRNSAGSKTAGKSVDALMMGGIDEEVFRPENPGEVSAGSNPHGMPSDGNLIEFSQGMRDSIRHLGGDILPESAAEKDVHDLKAPADPQDRFSA